MTILGIETSCDETAAAIVQEGLKILSNIVISSQDIHIKTGGIIPESAAREQTKYLIPVIETALQEAQVTTEQIDAIAVTEGPGLIGSLLPGVETAKTLAYIFQKPIVPINHLLAHLYANWLKTDELKNEKTKEPQFPAVGLIASGGHTDLLLMKGHGKFEWLGGTRDDAAGEAFDKIARLLGFDYPGGPAIARLAVKRAKKAAESGIRNYESGIKLPRPLLEKENFDFSFSGLKTAVLREVNKLKEQKKFDNFAIRQLAYETQEAITDVLVKKSIYAAQKYKVKSILLGGGVTANQRLRDKFGLEIKNLKLKIKFFIPLKSLCTDNAAVIASCAFFNYSPKSWAKIEANPQLNFGNSS